MRLDHPTLRTLPLRAAAISLVCLSTAVRAGAVHAGDIASSESGISAYRERIVKRFDFNEPENFGEVPKYWEEFGGESFPRFVGGGFDRQVGRESPPSFHLHADGRSVAFRYRGVETPIRPHVDYLISGWIKPDQLRHARAAITAYYLDRGGLPIPGTQRQARLIGGEGAEEGWHRVEVLLPAGPPEAFALGITLWVEQAEIWNPNPRPARHIERRDVRAGAWFDDIAVYRLPQVTLSATVPGQVFEAHRPTVLSATVTDDDPRGLAATLEVFDAAGAVLERRDLAIPCEAEQLEFPELTPGYYRARITVASGGANVAERRLNFAVLGKLAPGEIYPAQTFGFVLDAPPALESRDPTHLLALIAAAGVGAVKVPMWTGRVEAPGYADAPNVLERLINGLIRRRVDVTAVMGGTPPAVLKRAGDHAGSLLDVLSGPVESWRGFLNETVAPYASVLTSWQLGADADPHLADDARFIPAIAAVRRELLGLMTAPYLTVPESAGNDPAGRVLPVERLSLSVPRGVSPAWVGPHFEAFRGQGYLQVGAYLAPPPEGDYDRLARLGSWVAGIIEARHGGADIVYVPAPWRWRSQGGAETLEPTEEYVVFRTVCTLLREAQPDGELLVDSSVRALIFTHGERSVLAIWDPGAPAQGRTLDVQLGEAGEVIDLWGRATPLERGPDGRHQLTVTPLPQFVPGIERWVAALRRHVRFLPEVVAFSLATHRHVLKMTNPGDGVLSGEVDLEAPATWQVRPRHIDFSVATGEELSREIELKYNHNESAGPKTLWANLRIDGRNDYRLRFPLRFELGITDVDVWGYAVASGDGILVRHGVRNRSKSPISFRSFAAAPGRDRQYKIIIALPPGETEVKEFRLGRGAELTRRTLRLGLREVNGSRMHNLDVEVP